MTNIEELIKFGNNGFEPFVIDAFELFFNESLYEMTKDKIDLISAIYNEITQFKDPNIKFFTFFFISIMETFDDIIDNSSEEHKYANYQRLIIAYTGFTNVFSIIISKIINTANDHRNDKLTSEIPLNKFSDIMYSINALNILDEEIQVKNKLSKATETEEFYDLIIKSLKVRSKHYHLLGSFLNKTYNINNSELPELLVWINSWFILKKDWLDQDVDRTINSLNIYIEFSAFKSRQSENKLTNITLGTYVDEITTRILRNVDEFREILSSKKVDQLYNSLLEKYDHSKLTKS